jgi:hypothetical protein
MGYSWMIVLNIIIDVWFDNTYDWKGIWKERGHINIIKAYVTNDKTSRWILNVCFTSVFRIELLPVHWHLCTNSVWEKQKKISRQDNEALADLHLKQGRKSSSNLPVLNTFLHYFVYRYVDYFTVPSHNLTDSSEEGFTYHPSRLMGLNDILNTVTGR